jgi:hypothetical protein
MTKAEEIAYDIVLKQVEIALEKVRNNPLFQEYCGASFRDNLLFGGDTQETLELKKRMEKSIKQA